MIYRCKDTCFFEEIKNILKKWLTFNKKVVYLQCKIKGCQSHDSRNGGRRIARVEWFDPTDSPLFYFCILPHLKFINTPQFRSSN